MKKNKILLLFISLIISTVSLYSQYLPGSDRDDSYTQDNDSTLKNKYFFSANLKLVNCLDATGADLGIKIGRMIKENFSISGSYYYLFTQSFKFDLNNSKAKGILQLEYFGLETEYYIPIFNTFMISINAFLGMGDITFSQSASVETLSNTSRDWIFLAEPSININFKILNKTWIGLGAGYRVTSGVNFYNLRNTDLKGLTIPISLRFYL